MNALSRRSFLKGMAAAAGAGVLGGMGLTAFADDAMYTPGTYTASAQGIGTVTVTATFDENSITAVELDVSGETVTIGQAAKEALLAQIMDAQGTEIDGVSGATLTTKAVQKALANCIAQAKGEISAPVEEMIEEAEGVPGWLGLEPEVTEDQITETIETDFLVVGAGNGGKAAGAYAAKQGLDVLVIEKGAVGARVRGWYGAIDTDDLLAGGAKPCNKDKLRRELKRYASGKCNMSLFNVWIEESKAMHEFIAECYAEYSPDSKLEVTVGEEATWPEAEESGFFFPECEHYWAGGMNRNDIFEAVLNDAGHPVLYNTSLVKLEKDSDGKVCGVIARNTDTDAYIRIRSAHGVLLATGGYPFNTKMMEQLDPLAVRVTTTNVGNPTNTGDGIKAAVWAGAALQKESAPMIFDRGLVPPGVDSGYAVLPNGEKAFPGTEGQYGLGSQPFLKVNRNGLRFADESGTYDHILYAAANQPGGVYALIHDMSMPEDVQRFHTIGCSAGTRKNPQGKIDSNEKQFAKGNVCKADTLEELADQLGFAGEAKENFLATCARYNELYDMQADPDFGKQAYRLSALRNPPFYGFWLGGCILTTEQGILINDKAQAMDENSKPIDGLYVCGDNAGGFFYNNYPCLMPGVAMGRNMTFAIKAVKTAFALE